MLPGRAEALISHLLGRTSAFALLPTPGPFCPCA